MKSLLVFTILLAIKGLSRVFYRHELGWVGNVARDPWKDIDQIRLIVLLNHTSLYELLYLGSAPIPLLWRIARRGVVPAADKTIERPFVGLLYKFVAHQVVPISRARDKTWDEFLERIDPQGVVLMAPEGRMMRESGLDANGKPMTVRGGVADILQALGGGSLLIAYSLGLHHVQVPGKLPRVFQTVRLRLERLDIAGYVAELLQLGGPDGFKRSVIEDLQRRRDLHCDVGSGALAIPFDVKPRG